MAVLYPIAIPLCCLGLTLYYWFFKFRLLKVYREPPKLAAELILNAGSYLPWIAYLGIITVFINAYSLNVYVMSNQQIKVKNTTTGIRIMCGVILILSTIHMFLPFRLLCSGAIQLRSCGKCCKKKLEPNYSYFNI